MADSRIKRAFLTLLGRDEESSDDGDRGSMAINMLRRRPAPFEYARTAFVYHPSHGPSQTLTRFALRERTIELCRMRFGASPPCESETFADAAKALASMEDAVAAMVASGHGVLESEREVFRKLIVRHPSLEAALEKEASDELLQVNADYLLEKGDLRGELIMIMVRGQETKRWLNRNESMLLGPLARRRSCFYYRWSRGFIDRLELRETSSAIVDQVLDDFLVWPATLLLRELQLPGHFAHLVDRKILPPGLRELRLTRVRGEQNRAALKSLATKVPSLITD